MLTPQRFASFFHPFRIAQRIGLWGMVWGTLCGLSPLHAAPIRFASEATYPPFVTLRSDGSMDGIETRLIQAICAQQKLECVFLNQPFDSLIPGLKMGRFDGIYGGIEATAIRSKQVDFSHTLYPSQFALMVSANSTIQAFDPDFLKGKTIGVQQGTTFVPFLRARYRNIVHLNTYPSAQEALLELQSGRVDGVLADTPVLRQWLSHHKQFNARLIALGTEDRDFFGPGYAVAFRQDELALRQLFNRGLQAIQENGTYALITGLALSPPVSDPTDDRDADTLPAFPSP